MNPLLAAALLPLLYGQVAEDDPCERTFGECRQLLVDGFHLRAKLCFDTFVEVCGEHPQAGVAEAMAEVAAQLAEQTPVRERPSQDPALQSPEESPAVKSRRRPFREPAPEPPEPVAPSEEGWADADRERGVGAREQWRPGKNIGELTEVAFSGVPEYLLVSTISGGQLGYLSVATMLSTLRTSRDDSTIPLLTTPLLGAGLGLAGAGLIAHYLEPSPGSLALTSSAMLMGHFHGFWAGQAVAALGMSRGWRTAETAPLGLGISLASGALATAAGALVGPALAVDPGDVGLMNSGALWGWALASLMVASLGNPTDNAAVPYMLPVGASILAYDAILALSPFLDVPRPATWLVELGGASGLLMGLLSSPLVTLFADQRSADNVLFGYLAGTGALGALGGAALCLLIADDIRSLEHDLIDGELPQLLPFALPNPRDPAGAPTMGLSLSVPL